MKITKLRYGNTNTYLVGCLLIDTDLPGSMPALWRALKAEGIAPGEIRYVLATHYHPDHIGLIGELMESGVKLLLPEHQIPFVHASDAIFARDRRSPFLPINEGRAEVISCAESRAFLSGLGIAGEILAIKSHSPDGAALLLDDGNAFVGDLEPLSFLEGYGENAALAGDWDLLLRRGARVIHGGHANSYPVR